MFYLILAAFMALTSCSPVSQSIGAAPEFTQISTWLNSKPLTLHELRGKVVLVDFWTYSCINCIRELPHLNQLYNEYKDKGFVIVGVHSPEFTFEHNLDNIKAAIQRYDIRYPVAVDNSYGTWNAYKNRFWPASFLIDKEGNIRLKTIGEGHYDELESGIRELLGLPAKEAEKNAKTWALDGSITPETYLGYHRADGYSRQISIQPDTVADYSYNKKLETDEVGLMGKWVVHKECIEAKGTSSTIDIHFAAGRVYLVLSGTSPEPITVMLDGVALPQKYYTKDMNDHGEIFVHESRKYDLIDLHGSVEQHLLSVHIPEGVCAYAFTFGKVI